MNGKTLGSFFDLVGTFDPRVTATAAKKGTIFRYVPSVGSPEILVKADSGLTTNWVSAGGGGGAPTGDPNTLAYFDALGNLQSNLQAQFDELKNSVAVGAAAQTGSTSATGDASEARGEATGIGSSIVASGDGSSAYGYTSADGDIASPGVGSEAGGFADGAGSVISSAGIGSNARGHATSAGQISTSGLGSTAIGQVATSGSISASDSGAWASGQAGDSGTVVASNSAAFAHGRSVGAGSQIVASGAGAIALGQATDGGDLLSSSVGSCAIGGVDGANGSIQSLGVGSIAFGRVLGAPGLTDIIAAVDGTFAGGYAAGNVFGPVSIQAQQLGDFAFGVVTVTGNIIASGGGSHASGNTDSGQISASSVGSFAHGGISSSGSITASGFGSFANGFVSNGGQIIASGVGSHASGSGEIIQASALGSFAHGTTAGNRSLTATAIGSVAFGYAQQGFITASGVGAFSGGHSGYAVDIIASSNGAFAWGRAEDQSHLASGNASASFNSSNNTSGDYGSSFGLGHTNSSYGCMLLGRYGITTGATPGAWTATDPVFLVGNGTAIGAEATAYQIDKDGRILETAAKRVSAIRSVAASDNVSARTDRKLLLNDNAAGVNTLTLPAGEEGLEFTFAPTAANTGTWALAPSGLDTLDGNVPADVANAGTPVSVTFTGGVWYWI